MIASLAAVVLSTASAAGYATAAVAQERLAVRQAPQLRGLAMLRSPRWWLAIAPNALGAGLHVAALRYGSVVLVQPFGALTLVFALPLGATVVARHVTGREWRGAVAVLLGLPVLTLANDAGAAAHALSDAGVVWLVLATLAAVAALTGRQPTRRRPTDDQPAPDQAPPAPGQAPPAPDQAPPAPGRTPPVVRAAGGVPRSRTLRTAMASGICSGVASVLTQTVLLRLAAAVWAAGDPAVVLAMAATGGFAIGGLMLAQVAYAGGLGLPLAMLTIANPVVTTAIGLTIAGGSEPVSVTGVALTVLAVVWVSRGVLLLSTPHHPGWRANRRRRGAAPPPAAG